MAYPRSGQPLAWATYDQKGDHPKHYSAGSCVQEYAAFIPGQKQGFCTLSDWGSARTVAPLTDALVDFAERAAAV